MHYFSVCLSGEKIDAETLNLTLKKLALTACHLKGEPIVRRPAHIYPECLLGFEAKGFELLELLQYLLKLEDELRKQGVQSVEVHALMEKGSQINGELSIKEIAILSKLNANFTWSVL
ncbi:hypothetical protein [Loktanella sp. Alg231-35]|uniref:hypothetical protein n=1 Tax=Loktanella sp. Alg231-35 TaxID=1922220 RepID=UPI000D54C106|nr:hypothetical protein [Loktanella sp. Alg231-35]